MKRPAIGCASVLTVLLATAGVQAQSYSIGGKTYVPTLPTETVGVVFTAPDGGVTTGSYSGFVRLVVSGSGVSCTPATNDAFYIYEWQPGCGNPNVVPQHDAWFYQLTFDRQALIPLATSRVATNFIHFDIDAGAEVLSRPYVPAYRTNHTYSFIVNTGLSSAAPLHFGVSDGGFDDNSGSYQLQVTQLTEAVPIQVTSLSPNGTPPFSPGTAVTFTATATGGAAPLQYQFWLRQENGEWTRLQAYSPASQVTWTPAVEGTYLLQAWVRSGGSVAPYEAWRAYGPFDVKLSPLRVTSLKANVAFPVAAGTPVTWTATASGGIGPYTYQFWVFNGSAWALGRDWSGAGTWTWEPPRPGNHRIQVWARNAGSVSAYDAWGTADATIAMPGVLTVTTVTPSATSMFAGAPVTWTAMAAGGTGPYRYRFFVYDGAAWTVGQEWSTSPQWRWVPPAAGTYLFQVWVRNAGSRAVYDARRSFGPCTAMRPSALTVTALRPDLPAPAAVGTPVTWTATAAGGSGPYTYQFYVFDGAAWSLARDWSPSRQWTWVPRAVGSYGVQVWARNAGSGARYDAWRGAAAYAVTPAAPLRVTSPTADRVLAVPAGTPVTWTARGIGGTGPYTYKFFVFNGSAWAVGQNWSAANTWRWVPPAAGTYSIQVWVRNAGSASVYDAWTSVAATVSSPTTLSVPTVTVAPLAPLVAEAPAVVTASATGGTGPYTYQFYVHDGSAWSIGQNWSEENTFTWVPPNAGTYVIQVWLRNAGSTTAHDQWGRLGPMTVLP